MSCYDLSRAVLNRRYSIFSKPSFNHNSSSYVDYNVRSLFIPLSIFTADWTRGHEHIDHRLERLLLSVVLYRDARSYNVEDFIYL